MSRVSKPATNNSIDKHVKPRRNTPVAILTHSKRPNTFPKEHKKGLGAFILEPWWHRCTVLMFFRLCFSLSLLGHCIWKITKSYARETSRIQTMLGQPFSSIFSMIFFAWDLSALPSMLRSLGGFLLWDLENRDFSSCLCQGNMGGKRQEMGSWFW